MENCKNCGEKLQDGIEFCPNCGEEIVPVETKVAANAKQQVKTPADHTAEENHSTKENATAKSKAKEDFSDNQDAKDNKTMAILSYIWILFLIPLLTGAHKESKFVKYHLNQGILLCIFAVSFAVLFNIIFSILMSSFFLWWLSWFIWLFWMVPTIYSIIGMINVANEKCNPLPLIGKITILK